MRTARCVAMAVLGACGTGARGPASPGNTTASGPGMPLGLEPDCGGPADDEPDELAGDDAFNDERDELAGDDACVFALDLDGDGRDDRIERVRTIAPRARGYWITLATGATAQVGAGLALPEPPPPPVGDLEPLALDVDLRGISIIAVARREGSHRVRWSPRMAADAPCAGDGVVISGGDAAALLCWVDGTAVAYHLGF